MFELPEWADYCITEDAYKSLVMVGRDWIENPHANGAHTAYALDGINPKVGDFVLVECCVRFGRVNRPVVVFCSSQVGLVRDLFNRYQSDAVKLARYYGCKDVRYFEIWRIVPDDWKRYVLVECVNRSNDFAGETLITGEIVFDTEAEIDDYIKRNNLYIENYDKRWSEHFNDDGCSYYTYDCLYYYTCFEREDSICYESPCWIW